MRTAAAALALLLPCVASAQGPAARVDLVGFVPITLDEWQRIHRVSDSPPLKMAEVKQMQAAGIGDSALLEMIRTRRVADPAAPKDLIALKKQGATDDLIAALSAYALAENRSIDLLFTLDVRTHQSLARAPFLYLEFFQLDKGLREHLLFTDLRTLSRSAKTIVDRSDPLLPDRVLRVRRKGTVPIRHPGRVEVRALISKRPGLTNLDAASLSDAEKKKLVTWSFTLPQVSLYNDCELDLTLQKDELLPDTLSIPRKRFVCIFDGRAGGGGGAARRCT